MRLISLLTMNLVLCLATAIYAEVCVPGEKSTANRAAPISQLQGQTGSDFDSKYMTVMYQHHSDTASIAQVELNNTNDTMLNSLSKKIMHERYDLNKKLAILYGKYVGGELTAQCYPPPKSWMQYAGLASPQFDRHFVDLMIIQLQQARDAAQLAEVFTTLNELRNQTKILTKASNLEIAALQKWLQTTPES